jgi:biotin carboxyl carrier protein
LTNVEAELVGNVWKVLVKPGDTVEEEDTLVILESMKMEIPIAAPHAGRVAEVLVSENDVVQEGQVVVRLEMA